jgi:hypothetical protein
VASARGGAAAAAGIGGGWGEPCGGRANKLACNAVDFARHGNSIVVMDGLDCNIIGLAARFKRKKECVVSLAVVFHTKIPNTYIQKRHELAG